MKIGRWDKLPQYEVIGEKNRFYLWVEDDSGCSASNWIVGRDAFRLYNKLNGLFKKDKKAFIKLLKEQHEINARVSKV